MNIPSRVSPLVTSFVEAISCLELAENATRDHAAVLVMQADIVLSNISDDVHARGLDFYVEYHLELIKRRDAIMKRLAQEKKAVKK